jgi:ATP-dependent DNA helicase RecG
MALDHEKIEALLADLESDRVERTISTTNTDKFSEAICAFSNDFPNHNLPGYLIIGADDKTGSINGITIDDKLLKDIAAIRNNGQILPQPVVTVEKMSFPQGDLLVIEVKPSLLPPVRYKGKVCIRVGATKATANEAEENILTGRRVSKAKTDDALPAFESTLNDLNEVLFRSAYLPGAVDEAVIRENHRDYAHQLASLRLYDLTHSCPTNAGVLLLGNNPKYFLPGAYVQYVRYAGKGLESDVLNSREFSGDLITLMSRLDDFVRNNIEQRPVFVSPLREEVQRTYPFRAIRELLNNAVMHRSYMSNAPIKFYEFDDRIEISNPGGLYGNARPDNFPNANDYRNPVIAEAMKVLGYVNKFNRGVMTAKEELINNGNPEPKFEFSDALHFGVTIYKKA